jgi:hypothetical protein
MLKEKLIVTGILLLIGVYLSIIIPDYLERDQVITNNYCKVGYTNLCTR